MFTLFRHLSLCGIVYCCCYHCCCFRTAMDGVERVVVLGDLALFTMFSHVCLPMCNYALLLLSLLLFSYCSEWRV